MKKIMAATFITLVTLSFVSAVVHANPLSLAAENGIILPPTGVAFDLDTSFPNNSQTPATPELSARISYGVFPSVTVAGEFSKSLVSDGNDGGRKLIKVLFSPFHENKGYTIYLGYDLDKREIPIYGVSLWSNTKYLLTFINLQTNTQVQGTQNPLVISPGANLRITSKIRVGGEAEFKPSNWALQKLRVGANYSIMNNVVAKFDVERSFSISPIQAYQAGLTVQI